MIVKIMLLSALWGATGVAAEEPTASPVFLALSVPDLDASIAWYTEMLDLTATRLPEAPQAKVALLRGNGLFVELIEHAQAFDLQTRVPEGEKRYLVHGLFKAGFFVQDLDATVDRLERRGARFKGEAFNDPVARVRSILLLDNNDNVIQLFERIPDE